VSISEDDPCFTRHHFRATASSVLVNGKVIKNYVAKKDQTSLSNKIQPCKRCVIQKGPSSVRDTVILEIDSLNTVLLIEEIAMRVFKRLPCFPKTDPV